MRLYWVRLDQRVLGLSGQRTYDVGGAVIVVLIVLVFAFGHDDDGQTRTHASLFPKYLLRDHASLTYKLAL